MYGSSHWLPGHTIDGNCGIGMGPYTLDLRHSRVGRASPHANPMFAPRRGLAD
jgi:hypothetical protein